MCRQTVDVLVQNDLGNMKSYELYTKIECGFLTRFHTMCPNTRIIWSNIFVRRYWSVAMNGKALETARKQVSLLVQY